MRVEAWGLGAESQGLESQGLVRQGEESQGLESLGFGEGGWVGGWVSVFINGGGDRFVRPVACPGVGLRRMLDVRL